MTFPFFGGGKLVWWKAVNFFDETGVGRLASVKEALESLQPDLAQVDGVSVTLLISALGIHKGRAFSKASQARPGQIFRPARPAQDHRRRNHFPDRTPHESRRLRPGPGAAERFFQATGSTPPLVAGAGKTRLFSGEGNAELTRDDVNRVISGSRAA